MTPSPVPSPRGDAVRLGDATADGSVPATPAQPAERVTARATDLRRLRAVARYRLGDPALRSRLDAITERTRTVVGFPVSLVTIVLDDAQLFAGSSGVEGWLAETGGSPIEWSFCAHTVASCRDYVVEDAGLDPVQSTNPMVLHEGVCSYAGVPLVAPGGQVIGAHCVVGDEPHRFTRREMQVLEDAAAEVIAVLEQYASSTAGPDDPRRGV